jgi:hypothetical protein
MTVADIAAAMRLMRVMTDPPVAKAEICARIISAARVRSREEERDRACA